MSSGAITRRQAKLPIKRRGEQLCTIETPKQQYPEGYIEMRNRPRQDMLPKAYGLYVSLNTGEIFTARFLSY